ncbi:hypothetical protein SDC9_200500 [bioreactor metagenome]|uniref:Uncharacterized protein n=1 Tax=bioreactor metagenome TaxID=1076179 RepID=A0A645INL7_9ZZZZ
MVHFGKSIVPISSQFADRIVRILMYVYNQNIGCQISLR